MAIANAIGIGLMKKQSIAVALGNTWADFATGGANPKTWTEITTLGTLWSELI